MCHFYEVNTYTTILLISTATFHSTYLYYNISHSLLQMFALITHALVWNWNLAEVTGLNVGNKIFEEQLQISGHPHQRWPQLVTQHNTAGKEGPTAAAFSVEAEEVWHVAWGPQQLLQLHCWEHLDRLHHRLVRQHFFFGAQTPTQSGKDCREDHQDSHCPLCRESLNCRVHRRAASILKDPTNPQHGLFTLPPSGRSYRKLSPRPPD